MSAYLFFLYAAVYKPKLKFYLFPSLHARVETVRLNEIWSLGIDYLLHFGSTNFNP